MRSMILLASLAACATASPAPMRLVAGDYDLALAHGGRDRHYLVHVPPQVAAGKPLPVIVNFHGGGGNAEQHARWTNMNVLGDREGVLIVYPDGIGPTVLGHALHTFNSSAACCGQASKQNVDDVGFTFAALADLAGRAPVDRTRVYATGMSNGSMMAQRLAHDAPNRIAAVASISGANDLGDFTLTPPVPLMHIHSVDDPRALYQGGLGPPFPGTQIRTQHPPVERVVGEWVKADGCAATPSVGETKRGAPGTPDASHTATKLTWSSCRGGAEVVLWKLTGSGHVWPGEETRERRLADVLGESTHVIDANDEMWVFFKQFSRPDAPPL